MARDVGYPGLSGVAALAGVALLVGCGPKPSAPPSASSAAPAAAHAAAAPAKAAPAPADASAPSLQAAFALVYPKPQITVTDGDQAAQYDMKPQELVRVADGVYALISAGRQAGNPTHVDGGYASIAYLTTRPALALQGEPYPLGGTMGGFGEPAHIKVLTGIAATPVLQVETGFYNQGEGDSAVDLIALGATVKAVSVMAERIPFTHTQSGANGEDCDTEGTIVPVTADQVFEVQYSGALDKRQRYRRNGGKWSSAGTEVDLAAACK